MSETQTYLFSYDYNGNRFLLHVTADSEGEAKERVRRIGAARFDGKLIATFPAPQSIAWENVLTKAGLVVWILLGVVLLGVVMLDRALR